MITIDGSMGEGGGQILRTSLGLSALTGQPFRITDIRKNRAKPGLARQHLTAVRAAAEVCGAQVRGDAMRSTELTFEPGTVKPGAYHFAVGTAGSANLVLQTVLPPLMLADEPSELILEGGTHNDKSPPFHFLERAYAPLLRRFGPGLELSLQRWGFVPAGGGRFTAQITPVSRLEPVVLLERGPSEQVRAEAVVSALPRSIARRELAVVGERLGVHKSRRRVVVVDDPQGPGNAVLLTVESAHVTEVFTGFGRKGRAAERVAAEVCDRVEAYLGRTAPVGRYLADQLLLPMALAGTGALRTGPPTLHTTTHVDVIAKFLPVSFAVEELGDQSWRISVRRR